MDVVQVFLLLALNIDIFLTMVKTFLKSVKSLEINVEGGSYNIEHLDCLYLKKKRKKRL